MTGERLQQLVDLWNELKLAYDKAVQRFPDRLEDIDTVFSVTDALRISISQLDSIASQESIYGDYCIQLVDDLHTALWNDRELFDSLSHHTRALFTWREHPVEWRGKQISNIVEAIRNEALQYSGVLQTSSLYNTLAPSEQLRGLYPEPWFDVAAVQNVASHIRERMEAAKPETPAESPIQPVEQVEQRKIKLPTNPDVAEVWNAVQAVESGTANVAEICRSIAEKRGCNANSLRSMFNTWKRKNIG